MFGYLLFCWSIGVLLIEAELWV